MERAREYGHDLMRRIVIRTQEAGELRADWTLEVIAFITWSHTSVGPPPAPSHPRSGDATSPSSSTACARKPHTPYRSRPSPRTN